MNLRLKYIDQEPGRSAYHLYGNFGENFPAMILTLAVNNFSKNFQKVPLESKCNTLFGKFLEETGHLKR